MPPLSKATLPPDLQRTYNASDWMGELCLVCERTSLPILHTHTEEERRAAQERRRAQFARKVGRTR
jgi:hypothetical protein